jgi:hypothetical protein
VWRYIKSAYLVGVDVPLLGRVPVNLLLTAGFVILGVAQPAFWLLGLAVECTIVAALAFHPRFQKYVQAQELQMAKDDDETRRQKLIQLLEPDAHRRLSALNAKCNKVIDVYRAQQAEDYLIDSNRDALNRLEWNYLKLLVARHHMLSAENGESEQSLEAKIRDLQQDLQNQNQPESLRESKAATVAILKKRLDNIQRRSESFQEIDSDCTRIEAQVDLILENASIQGKPQTIASDIELASDLLGVGIFGDDESAVSHLDRKYSAARQRQEAT